MRLIVRWLNSALIASKPSAIAITGITSPIMKANETGIGSGAMVNRLRKRNGLSPIVSRIAVVDNHATKRATRNTKASMTTMRMPPRWSAVSLAMTVPSPVHGDPSRCPPGRRLLSGIAGLLEIAVVDLGEARCGKADAEELRVGGEQPGDIGAQVALAIDAVEVGAERLHPYDPGHRGEAVMHARSLSPGSSRAA